MSLKLNLGCGGDIREGYCNVDVSDHEGVDVVHDLNKTPWPWSIDTVDEILAIDVLEHLDDYISFFNEAHLILRDGCEITVQVPHYTSRNFWIDPTHKRAYDERSFDYLDDRTDLGQRYGRHYTRSRWQLVKVIRDYESGNLTATLRAQKSTQRPDILKPYLGRPITPEQLMIEAEKTATYVISLPEDERNEQLADLKKRNEVLYMLVKALLKEARDKAGE